MPTWRTAVLATCLVALLATMPPAWGVEGHTPIGSAPFVISAPGHYVLTDNLTNSGNVLQVLTTADVILDLNGFRVHNESTVEPVILIAASSHVTVRNGRITGGANSVGLLQARNVVLEDLQTEGAETHAVNAGNGTLTTTIRRCTFVDHGGAAVFALANTADFNITIEGCRVTACAAGFKLFSPRTMIVKGNRLNGLIGRGIEATDAHGGVLSANVISNIGGDGIFVDSTSRGIVLIHNSITDASGVGIQIDGHDNLLHHNTSTGNDDTGLVVVGARNVLLANVLNGNGAFGLHLEVGSQDTVYRGNMARNNIPSTCTAPATDDFCDDGTGNSSSIDNFLPAIQ